MIKGVNKQILEVTNTESPYFERIIYFVRPESQKIGEEKLHDEAMRIAKSKAKPPRQRKTSRQRAISIAYCVLGAGAGVSVMMIVNSLM